MNIQIFVFLISSFMLTFVFVGIIRKYAINKKLIDIPNGRSSHKEPTPRGGGVAIIFIYLVCVVAVQINLHMESIYIFLVSIPSLLVSLIGVWDDHGHLDPKVRLAGHFFSASLFLFFLPKLPISFINYEWADYFLYIVASFYLVWMLNLYNFMDGIDGIAAVESISVCIGGSIIWWVQNGSSMVIFSLLIAATSFGFLLWNFPKAKIFMGDGGSGFLGFTLGCFAIIAGGDDERLFWAWNILLGVFIVDSTLTLFTRILRGKEFLKAHRSHAYQNAARKYSGHKVISVSVVIINILWLFPIACLVITDLIYGPFAMILSYLPLIALSLYFKAGKEF